MTPKKLKSFQCYWVEIFNTKFLTNRFSGITGRNFLTPLGKAWLYEKIFMKNLLLPGRRCVKNPYAEYHENLTDGLDAVTRSHAGMDETEELCSSASRPPAGNIVGALYHKL
jgi:hypothetical protein